MVKFLKVFTKQDLIAFCNNKKEKAFVVELLDAAQKDVEKALMVTNVKIIKPFKCKFKIYEMKKDSLRIFYILEGGTMYIVHAIHKNRPKIEQKDKDIIKNRIRKLDEEL